MLTYVNGVLKWIWGLAGGGTMLQAAWGFTSAAGVAALLAAAVSPGVVIPYFLAIVTWLLTWLINYFQANLGFTPPTTVWNDPFVKMAIAGAVNLNVILPIREACLLGLFLIGAKLLAALIVSIRRMVGVASDRAVIASNS